MEVNIPKVSWFYGIVCYSIRTIWSNIHANNLWSLHGFSSRSHCFAGTSHLLWCRIGYVIINSGYLNIKLFARTNWFDKYCATTGMVDGSSTRHDMPFDHIIHVIIIPNYKEDMTTLCESLDILASHKRSLTQYRVFF
jgi:hypothetical protein